MATTKIKQMFNCSLKTGNLVSLNKATYSANEMSRDGTLSTHDDEWEKILGYRYNPLSEKLPIASDKGNPDVLI